MNRLRPLSPARIYPPCARGIPFERGANLHLHPGRPDHRVLASPCPGPAFAHHHPVFEGKKPIGIVSIGDLVKSIIGDQKFVIFQLEHIHGERAVVDG